MRAPWQYSLEESCGDAAWQAFSIEHIELNDATQEEDAVRLLKALGDGER
jgi:hypothetical protein